MDMPDLSELARTNRMKREASTALILSVLVLAGLYSLPFGKAASPAASAVSIASSTPDAFADIALHAKAAIVYDLATGQTLYAKNANAQLPLASITKLLTAYTAVKELGEGAPVTITPADIAVEGDSGFSAGETFRLRDLARLTLTGSINDGAAALASAAATRKGEPVPRLLAGAAAGLNLSQTYAIDGSGLDTSSTISGGYGSAHDVALLAGALLAEAPDIAEATTQRSDTEKSLTGVVHTKPNTNTHVSITPRILLSKTGYTDLAGGNLVIVFDAAVNHPVAVVALGSTEEYRFTDVDTMVNATLAHFAGTENP